MIFPNEHTWVIPQSRGVTLIPLNRGIIMMMIGLAKAKDAPISSTNSKWS